jgi:NAD(P)-dependent dehydrogenase (short-subunit alcohol dehydrogenase family)
MEHSIALITGTTSGLGYAAQAPLIGHHQLTVGLLHSASK